MDYVAGHLFKSYVSYGNAVVTPLNLGAWHSTGGFLRVKSAVESEH